MSEITHVLAALDSDPRAADALLPLVYQELRELAGHKLACEKPGQTLQATALVHEAYLRLVGPGQENNWNSRGHFFAAAAEAMRRILVEKARRTSRLKHGGAARRLELDQIEPACSDRTEELLAIHEALETLQVHDAQAAQLVKLRYFAGLPHQDAAAALGISRRAADRLWALARNWLYRSLNQDSQ